MFIERLTAGIEETGGSLCVGLDPHPEKIPDRYPPTPAGVRDFLFEVIDLTLPHACTYKPNIAFFEALGGGGLGTLHRIVERVHNAGRPVILDAKRCDISSTARAYARAAFDVLEADAITVVPYMGTDAVLPFLDCGGFVFVLVLPSNPSAEAVVRHGSPPLYLRIGEMVRDLSKDPPARVGMVVGGTRPEEAKELHILSPQIPWLVPGFGAQGGDVEAFFAAVRGHETVLVSASRSIVFSKTPREDAARLKGCIEEVKGGRSSSMG